jgi:hypothetical protein
MKRFAMALVLVMIAQPLAESGDATPAEDARLERLFKAYLDSEFKHRPLDATRLGDHRFDDLLDDVSPQARAANAARTMAHGQSDPSRAIRCTSRFSCSSCFFGSVLDNPVAPGRGDNR